MIQHDMIALGTLYATGSSSVEVGFVESTELVSAGEPRDELLAETPAAAVATLNAELAGSRALLLVSTRGLL